jgi:glycosyltransferase involved in cell wall biosynthesis
VAGAPLVTVITATYNRSAALACTLRSLLGQSLTDFEAWVVGDACTDDSQAVVEALGDPRLHWLNLPRNSGSQAAPNNAGLERARGQYVAYLGHDDLWLPHHLAEAVAWAEATGADLVHTLCALLGPEGRLECVGPPNRFASYATHFAPPSSWLHRRSVVETVGRWADPERIELGVDHDFLVRVSRAGKPVSFCPRLTVLKFPSVWFARAYAYGSDLPQRRYLEQLLADPAQVEQQLLQALAVAYARAQWGGDPPVRAALVQPLGVLERRVAQRWGGVRWLRPLFVWRYQSVRRRQRRRRGLPGRR